MEEGHEFVTCTVYADSGLFIKVSGLEIDDDQVFRKERQPVRWGYTERRAHCDTDISPLRSFNGCFKDGGMEIVTKVDDCVSKPALAPRRLTNVSSVVTMTTVLTLYIPRLKVAIGRVFVHFEISHAGLETGFTSL
jgi:hypothetical protein